MIKRFFAAVVLAVTLFGLGGGASMAVVQHGANPAQGGASANPNGNGPNGGGGIHNIEGGAPGQNGGKADDRPPACTMHGGMADADANPNC